MLLDAGNCLLRAELMFEQLYYADVHVGITNSHTHLKCMLLVCSAAFKPLILEQQAVIYASSFNHLATQHGGLQLACQERSKSAKPFRVLYAPARKRPSARP